MTVLKRLKLKSHKAPLSPFMCRVCWLIFRLDRIPRYGRLYPLIRNEETGEYEIGKAEWSYHKHGWWGLNLLKDLGLLWAYIDTMQPYDQNGEVDAAP